MSNFEDFQKKIKKVSSTRTHKATNSYGIRGGYNYYRSIKPKDPKYILTDCEYYSITRAINNKLRELVISGEDIIFPSRMGGLELRKYEPNIKLVEGKVTNTFPIDWYNTIKLWYEDEEAHKNKTLVKSEEKEVFKVLYNRAIANYINKSFYEFKVNREIKKGLKNNIKAGTIDAFKL